MFNDATNQPSRLGLVSDAMLYVSVSDMKFSFTSLHKVALTTYIDLQSNLAEEVDPSAAELSHRCRKMVTRRISAENWTRPGDRRRRRNKLRRLAEFVGNQ